MIGYFDEVIRALVLILPKMSKYVRRYEDKGRGKTKNKKLISWLIDDHRLLEKYKTIWTNIEDLSNTG